MESRRGGWRLSPGQRKATVLLHILCGIGWMGADIVLMILLSTGLTTDDGAVAAASYRAVSVFVPVAVPVFSLGVLGTGLLLGWGTKWGILRHWWVMVKLALSVVMVVLVFVALVPGVNDLEEPDAALSAEAVRDSLGAAPTDMFFPPVVSFLMLGIAAVLSVSKPWRRTPWGRPSRLEREAEDGAGEAVDAGSDLFEGAGWAGEALERFEARQGEEGVHGVAEVGGGGEAVLGGDAGQEVFEDVAAALVPEADDRVEVLVQGGEGVEAAGDAAAGTPEAGEDGDDLRQTLEGVGMGEGCSHSHHATGGGEGVAQGFEEPGFGAELVVDGGAGDVGLAGDGVDGEAGEAVVGVEQVARGGDDAVACLVDCHLAAAELVGTRAHRVGFLGRGAGVSGTTYRRTLGRRSAVSAGAPLTHLDRQSV